MNSLVLLIQHWPSRVNLELFRGILNRVVFSGIAHTIPMRRLIMTVGIIFFSAYPIYAQSGNVAGLFEKLKAAEHDTTRVNIYYSISRFYWYRNPDSALLMAQRGLDLARQHNFKKGIALSLLTKGVAYVAKGEYPKALACHFEALEISEELQMEGLTGNNYNNIGIAYSHMGNSAKALEYYEKSLAIAKKFTNKDAVFSQLINIAEIHMKDKAYDKALEYDMKALKVIRESNDSAGIAITLFNIGDIYQRKGAYAEALKYLPESLAISKKINDKEGIAYSYNTLAHIYKAKNEFKKSIQYAEISLRSYPDGHKEVTKDSYSILYTGYQQLRNFEKALQYRNMEIALKDSMFSIEKEREVNNIQATYDLQKKQHQIDLLNKDKIIQQEELNREKFQRNTFIAGVCLLSLVAVFLIRNNSIKQRNNNLLKKQNEEIIEQKEEISIQNEKISKQNIRLEELNSLKNRLFSIVSHDFRSPLHSLQSIVVLMEGSDLTAEEMKHMSTLISSKLGVTIHLLENLLFWAKSQMEGETVNARPFDLRKIVDENIHLLQSQAEHKKIELVNALPETVPVFADSAMIDIVIRNLMSNAVKFTNAEGVVSILVTTNDEFVQVTVKDTGQGIPPENLAKVFNSINSFTTPGTSFEKGTGLGLALCKELVEKNGGKIWFESERRKGSAFMFTLSNKLSITDHKLPG